MQNEFNILFRTGLIFLILILPFLQSCRDESVDDEKSVVIMLSMDGFRWDYPDLYHTPNLDNIAANGVKAESLIPVFPTKTFPNHYTLATGLYPDKHGIVNNSFFDPETKQFYRIGKRSIVEDPHFYGGEPIWVTAEKQGVRTASFFWVGSEAPVKGVYPSIWKRYDESIPYEARIDSVINWVNLPPGQRPRLITWYMDEPDHTGHDFGPFHDRTEHIVEHLDSLIGIFTRKLYENPANRSVNIIILSDHGMGEIKSENYIDIDKDLPDSWIDYIVGYNPVMFIQPLKGFKDSIYNRLKSKVHLNVWKKEEIPGHLNYGKNPRISDLVLVADSGWSIGTEDNPEFTTGGAHGYDFRNTDMHSIFYAAGPAFKENIRHPSLHNVDIYLLLSKLLDIAPEPNDGNPDRIKNMLKNPELFTIGQE